MKTSFFTLFVAPLLVGFLVPAASAATVTIPVSEDTWVDGLSSNSILGSEFSLGICPLADYWIYLKFDLSSVSGSITDAELRMTRFDGGRPEEISIYLVTDDTWTEATLDGVGRPAPTDPANNTALGTGQDFLDYDRWASPNFTAVVDQERAGDGILSLMVREDSAEAIDVRRYFSREAPQPMELKPQLILTTIATETIVSGWVVADLGEGTKPSFDFDAQDRLHVMAMTEEFNGHVWYASSEHVEAPWAPVEVATGYFYGPGDLRVGFDGTTHISWHNHDAQDPDHIAIHTDGSMIRPVVHSDDFHDGWDNSLVIEENGILHMASINPSAFGAVDSLQYGSFDGSTWDFQDAIPGSGSFMYGLNTSIAIDQQNDIHIVYCTANDWITPGDLKYAVLELGVWTISTVVSNGIRGRFPSLDLDQGDRPHIAWLDLNEANPAEATVQYGFLNSGDWVIEPIDTLTNVNMGFSGARKSVSLNLDSSDRPHVAYSDQNRVTYATKPSDTWMITNVLEHAFPTYNGLVVLRLDSQDQPGIVFWQPAVGGPGLVRLARPRDSNIRIFGPERDVGTGDVTLNWSSGQEGLGYRVEATINPGDGAWQTVSGMDLLTTRNWTDSNAGTFPNRFYQIIGVPFP